MTKVSKHQNPTLFTLLTALLIVVTFASSLPAHPTSEMEAIRLALKTWALAVLNQDMDELANILHEDFLFNDDMDKKRYVEVYGPNLSVLSHHRD